MAPILIDNRGLIKLGFISVFTVVLVFAAGFFNGYQQASSFYLAGSQTEVLALPAPDAPLEGDLDPQSPETVVAGEDIDVDHVPADVIVEAKSIEKILVKKNIEDATESSVKQSLSSTQPEDSAEVNVNVEAENIAVEKTIRPAIDVFSLSSKELGKIKYSIQAGMYGRLVNAENMMKMLQAKQFDAYVSDYTNKKNQVRYNVRFGYFPDKKSALAELQRFKDTQKSEGYLVNFALDSITKLADATNTKQTVPAKDIDLKDAEVLPVKTVPESVQKNLSRSYSDAAEVVASIYPEPSVDEIESAIK